MNKLKNSIKTRMETPQISKIKFFLIISMAIFLLGFVSASLDSLGTFKQNSNVRVAQICNDATSINISSIIYPNSSIAVANIQMTFAGDGEFYYDFVNANVTGRYDVRGISNGCENTFAAYFDVIKNLKETISNGQAILYTFILVFLVLTLALSILFAIKIDGKNKKDEENKIVSINDLKYLKFALFFISYLILYVIITIIYELCFTYLEIDGLNNILQWIYIVMGWSILPILVLTIIIIVSQKILDNKLEDYLERGTGDRYD